MKTLYYLAGLTVIVLWACSPAKNSVRSTEAKAPVIQDSLEYEIIITDIGFNDWYIMNYSPAKDYSNDYYRRQNQVAVLNWNEYFRTGQFPRVVDDYINYRHDVDYGIEVNRKLFWYFKYVEETYALRLFL
jgi:hypothetical protein